VACWARASLSAAGRSRLPTWSARNGGFVGCMWPSPFRRVREAPRRVRRVAPSRSASLPPHLFGQIDDLPPLCPLLVLGEDVAFFRRRKAALRAQGNLLERRELHRLVDAALDVVLLLERAGLRRDQTEHHDLVAPGQEAQRLEAARTLGVVFEEIAVIVRAAEQDLGDRLIAA